MKAVFPCKGVVVITKQNVDMLTNFYEGNLINSKLFSAYSQNNFSVQVGSFNYFPQNSTIILEENTNLLTIQELNKVLAQTAEQQKEEHISQKTKDVPIEDNFIKDHPFFQTLKPLN
ncbi:MAG: hypothetical protein OSJ66_01595 [Clostridia bacterium]|nr:hypothetical protein [Clostridia bacterium]